MLVLLLHSYFTQK